MSAEHQFEIKPAGSDAWELLQDWTEDGSILATGYPLGATGLRVRDRDSEDHEDVSDWVEVEYTRVAVVVGSGNGTRFDFSFTDQDGLPLWLGLASAVDVVFLRPDRTTMRKGLTVTDTVAGLAVYYATADELSSAGAWAVQGSVETPSGRWHTSVKRFRIYQALEAAA